MSSNPQRPAPSGYPAGTLPKDVTVDISNLSQVLGIFLRTIGAVHLPLFGKPCIVTAGRDGKHAPGSKHYTGNALDLRTADKDEYQQVVFMAVLLCLAREMKLAVFDESNVPGAGHVHVEVAG